MGFEDEAEQSKWRPCRLTDSRSKRTYELTSSIVPRGTSVHRSVDLGFPPIALIYVSFMQLQFPWSSGTRYRQPRCGA